MNKIKGRISLSSTTNITSSIRSYNTKSDRNRIIKLWQKLYATKKNAKKHFIVIEPELNKTEIVESGFVSIYNDKNDCLESCNYKTIDYREKTIQDWVKKHKLKKFYIQIIPDYEN